MEFTDLPRNWDDYDLRTGDLATGVIDLFLDIPTREAGCLLLLFLDGEGRLLAPVVLDEVPQDATPEPLLAMLEEVTSEEHQGLGVIVALGRLGAPFSTPQDRAWANALREMLMTSQGCRLRGFYLATPSHIRELVLGAAGRLAAPASA